MNAIGLSELVAQTPQEYVRIASELANDRDRLINLRRGMRARVENSPLREPIGLTRAVESAYRQFWHAWCSSGN
jgi:predicted O-linked N-acetylglucosamine transferase (SPINDLY family)